MCCWKRVATSALSAGEKSYTTSEVGAEVRRTLCPRGGGQEELPHVQGQGQQPRVPGCDGTGTAERSYPSPRSEVAAERSHTVPEAGAAAERSNPTSKEQWLRRA